MFAGTRVPVRALFKNLEAGASANDFLEWFSSVDREQVVAVLAHAERRRLNLPVAKVSSSNLSRDAFRRLRCSAVCTTKCWLHEQRNQYCREET